MKTVLITGASTGIGAAAARHMAAKGWRVFAGVRKAADGDALKAGASGDIRPIILDVTRRSLVMTSRGPVIIPSRSDTHQTIVGEIALGVVVAQRLQEASP